MIWGLEADISTVSNVDAVPCQASCKTGDRTAEPSRFVDRFDGEEALLLTLAPGIFSVPVPKALLLLLLLDEEES